MFELEFAAVFFFKNSITRVFITLFSDNITLLSQIRSLLTLVRTYSITEDGLDTSSKEPAKTILTKGSIYDLK